MIFCRKNIHEIQLQLLETASTMCTWVLMFLAEILMVVGSGMYVNASLFLVQVMKVNYFQ
jgi:hypothetical protein